MAAAEQISLIIDDSLDEFFQFSPNASTPLSSSGFYNGTGTLASPVLGQSITQGQGIFVEILFNGTSIAIFGNTSVPDTTQKLSQSFLVIIDGVHPVETSYDDINTHTPSYQQWYHSPILSDGPHNVTLANVVGASIDFAVITVNASTTLSVQQPVIVDDGDLAAITYTGVGWVEDVGENNLHPLGDVPFNSAVAPYGNSAHLGTRVGDGFFFNFTGNDLTVRGLMDWTTAGTLGLRFTLDGVIRDVALNTSSQQEQLFDGPIQPNYPFYVTPKNLTAGPHTLGVQVLQTTNLSFIFDYITFVPSATPPVTDSVTLQPTDSLSKTNIGVIIGCTVGGLALVLLAILIFDCVRRRKRQLTSEFSYPFRKDMQPGRPFAIASSAA